MGRVVRIVTAANANYFDHLLRQIVSAHCNLDVIPDVFVTDNEGDVMTANYKGVSIISAGHWRINLRTREINKVDSV